MPSPKILINAGEDDMLNVELCVAVCLSKKFIVYVVVSNVEQTERLKQNCSLVMNNFPPQFLTLYICRYIRMYIFWVGHQFSLQKILKWQLSNFLEIKLKNIFCYLGYNTLLIFFTSSATFNRIPQVLRICFTRFYLKIKS